MNASESIYSGSAGGGAPADTITEDAMNAQERLRRKRRKQMYRRLRLLVPIVVVVLLIAGLTAGGIILSLNQTRKTEKKQEEQTGNDKAAETGEDNTEDGSRDESAGEDKTEDGTEEDKPQGAADFEGFVSGLRAGYAQDSAYLSASGENLDNVSQELKSFDVSSLTQEEQDLYDALSDRVSIEEEGKNYQSTAASISGQRFCEVEGGIEYYAYLLRYLSGTDYDAETARSMLADELNSQYAVIAEMKAADPSLAQTAESLTKKSADTAYQFSTVTAASDALLTSLACQGLNSGWAEFGLIRAYQTDAAMEETVKNYLIDSTRVTYAAYGLVDISVHSGGWDLTNVTELCNNYFGGGQEAFAQSLYQSILENPGRYAAASIGYLELVNIEAQLAAATPDYTEQVLFDFLFDRGPASFRVYRSWLE